MKTIDQKLAIVRTVAAAAEFSEAELRHLIHGTGGSPRRAKRLLRTDIALARMLAEQYRIALEEGHAHISAVKLCSEQYRDVFGIATAEAIADAEAVAPVRRRRVKVKPLAEAAAALAAIAQPALL